MTTTEAWTPTPQVPPVSGARCGAARTALPIPPATVRPLAAVADRLGRADGGVSVVVAPGGYGKTSQVALWAGSDQRTVAWVDLETGHDDPERFLQVIVEALDIAADVRLEMAGAGRQTPHQLTTFVAPELGRTIGRSTTPFVLVLDDVQILRNQPSVDMLEALVHNVPAASTIVLIGRSTPPLALPALRAQGRAIDVTIEQLSLDEAETRAVAEAMGVHLDDSIADDLVRDTDGWPLGVHLVGGALAGPANTAPSTRRTHDEAVAVAHRYVEDEWLRGLAPADADLLRRVSGLGWVSGALCDHVLGTSDSGMRLERLHASGLLVAPLDRRGDSFRVHQVIRDSLDESFQRRDRDAHRAVHQRACDWFESSGDVDRAVEQALHVDDVERAGTLVIEYGARYHTNGRTQTVKRWLDGIPRDHVLRSPGLCLVSAVVSLGAGDGEAAAAWTRFGEDALAHTRIDPDPTVGAKLRSFRSMLWVDPIEESLAIAAGAAEELTPGIWKAFASTIHGALSFAFGDDATAIDALTRASVELHVVGAPSIEALALAHLALVRSLGDQPDEALRIARQARQLVRDHELEHMPTLALVTATSALVEATSGDSDVARSDLILARTHLAYLHSIAEWHHLQANIALAYASLRLGDLVAARMFRREAELLLERHGDAVRCTQQIADLTRQLRSAKDVLPCGPSSLTTAELRVLHYLPTNLTHEEIAARLYVSRNTTKSHAASIYRKLGVASRSEAVEVARTAGLLATS
jgi:LuxR family transcriptional regulator, maltose regulon positive regulatory protein